MMRLLFALFLAVMLQQAAAAPTTTPTTGDAKLHTEVEAVLKRIEGARARVPAVKYRLRYSLTSDDQTDRVSAWRADMLVVRDGNRCRTERVMEEFVNGAPQRTIESRTLTTESRFVLIDDAHTTIREWEYKLNSPLPQDVSYLNEAYTSPELFKWGFGVGNYRSLRQLRPGESLSLATDARPADQSMYLDLNYTDAGRTRLIWRYTIDPTRGFLITSGTEFDESGDVIGEFTVEAKQIAPAVWMPVKVTMSHSAPNRRSMILEVVEVDILADAEREFELAVLKPNEGARVHHFHPNGRSEIYRVRGGESIPDVVDQQLSD